MINKKKFRKINFSKLIRISDTPHSISLGFSIGVFASFNPLIGVHIIIAIFISWLLKANYFSSILGTFIGTPLTYPFIWIVSLYVGNVFIPVEDFDLSLLQKIKDYVTSLKPKDRAKLEFTIEDIDQFVYEEQTKFHQAIERIPHGWVL